MEDGVCIDKLRCGWMANMRIFGIPYVPYVRASHPGTFHSIKHMTASTFTDILCCATTRYLPLAMRLVCLTGSRECIFHRAGDELRRCFVHAFTYWWGEMGGDSLRSANHRAGKMTQCIAQSPLPLGDALSRSHSCFRTWEMEPLGDFIALRHISLCLCWWGCVM